MATPPRSVRLTMLVGALVAVLTGVGGFLALRGQPDDQSPPASTASAPSIVSDGLERSDDGTFRLVLSGRDIAGLVEAALDGSPTALARLGVDIAETGPEAARLEVSAVVDSTPLPVRVVLDLERAGERLDVSVSETRLAGLSLPAGAAGAVDDMVDNAADLGGLLDEIGVELTGLDADEEALVLSGRADDPEALEQRLLDAARHRAEEHGARAAPEERVGRGRLHDSDLGPEPAYVALGDSITAATGAADLRDGFASRLHTALEDRTATDWSYANLAVPGATTRSVIDGGQLAEAADVLADHDAMVTLTVGSNELLALLEESPCAHDASTTGCEEAIEQTAERFRSDLVELLEALEQADPDARVVVMGLYSPFSFGTGTRFEARADQAVARLSAVAERQAALHGAVFAPAQATFHRRADSMTGMTRTQPDIHPSPLGHSALAAAALKALDRDADPRFASRR